MTEARGQGSRSGIGVHVGRLGIRAVELRQGKIASWVSAEYPTGLSPAAPGFPAFLGETLTAAFPGIRRSNLWAVEVSPSLQVRFLSVPRSRSDQLSNTVYWTFRKEIPFDPATVRFDYGVEGETETAGARRVSVTAHTVARHEMEALRDSFTQAGLPLSGIVIPGFAVRNLFRSHWVAAPAATTIVLQVCDEVSVILVLRGDAVIGHRLVQTGFDSLVGAIRDRWPVLSAEQARALLRWAGGAPRPEDEPHLRAPPADAPGVWSVVTPIVDRIAQQVDRTVAANLQSGAGDEAPAVLVAGDLATLPRFLETLRAQSRGETQAVDPLPDERRADGSRQAPPDAAAWGMAVGAALSTPARTPNLLRTYAERDADRRAIRNSVLTALAGGFGLAVVLGALGTFQILSRSVSRELASVRGQLSAFRPQPDREMVTQMAAEAKQVHADIRAVAVKHTPMAVLNEVAALTPEDIRLSSLTYRLAPRAAPGAKEAEERFVVRIEGRVRGPWGKQESKLTSFAVQLEDSPLFEKASVHGQETAREGNEQVLSFKVDVEVSPAAAPAAAAPAPAPVPAAAAAPEAGRNNP